MKRLVIAALAAFALAAQVFAAGGGGGGSEERRGQKAEDPVVTAARAAIAKEDWAGAQAGLKDALAANPRNADYHNLYAYSMRKGPNPDMDLVFKHYQEALRIDPKHRGAHEYIGEAYLQANNLPKAREHLAALDRLCFFGCEEYTDLKKAVAAYEASPRAEATPQR
jgi:tetratricopeptide (TPR) repeat protein